MSDPCRIGVLAVGSVLMGDGGIGPFIVKILESRYEFPENVVPHDLGTPGLGITSFFVDYDAIILIDSVSAKREPGSVKRYRRDQLVRVSIPQRVSPHDPALVEGLLFAELSGHCPREVLLVGIVPDSAFKAPAFSSSKTSAISCAPRATT